MEMHAITNPIAHDTNASRTTWGRRAERLRALQMGECLHARNLIVEYLFSSKVFSSVPANDNGSAAAERPKGSARTRRNGNELNASPALCF